MGILNKIQNSKFKIQNLLYLLYDILLHLSLIILLPYFLFKMAVRGKYKQGLMERFGVIRADKINRLGGERPIWFHAVSVGETKAVVPLVKRLREEYPDIKIVFSTVTTTGNSIAMKNLPWVDAIIFFPLDLSWVVRRVVRKLKPRVFIVVEKEIWPNLLRILRKEGVSVVVVNGTISSRSFKRYRLFMPFFSIVFKGITLFCVQGREDRERVLRLGVERERVRVTGNIKFDEGPSTPTTTEMLGLMETLGLSDGDGVIVAGSTHRGEEEVILDVFKRLKREFHGLRLIIAPRRPERFQEVEGLIRGKGFSLLKRSETHRSLLTTHHSYDVILLDTMGELGRVYSLATVAFVGGSLVDVGGHNLLEPAFQRRPVLFGPHVGNYSEIARTLVSARGGVMVEDGEGLWRWSRRFLLESDTARQYGEAAYEVVEANRGAVERTLEMVEGFVEEKNSSQWPVASGQESITHNSQLTTYHSIFRGWMDRQDIAWFIHTPLYLLSVLYGLGVWLRFALYRIGVFKTMTLPCKVISVGNITVGGSGKTPMAIYIAELLRYMGKRVVILSRGYGRRGRGGVVSDGVDTLLDPETAGDEPYLIAERLKGVPVLVGKDRYSVGIDAVKRFTPDVVILDDGFQHIGLKRDMDILLVDERVGFGNGYLLPRGILREPLKGIERADVIMVKVRVQGSRFKVQGTALTAHNSQLITHNYNGPVFSFSLHPTGLRELTTGRDVGLDTLKGRKVFALAGIANSLSFIETLEGLGAVVVGRLFYPDHYWYTHSDINEIMNKCQMSNVKCQNSKSPIIVTTAKDGVKLRKFKVNLYVLDIETKVDEDFKDFLNQRLKTSKSVNQTQQVEVDTRVRALYTCI